MCSRFELPPTFSCLRFFPRTESPKVRLPGVGGALEIAASAKEVLIKAFMYKLDFVTSIGHGEGFDHHERLGLGTKGPTAVITDLGVLTPEERSKELTLTSIHPGVTLEQVRAATAWELKISDKLQVTRPPNPEELRVLRDL
jgi:glutaconate CoA-transferase, subunit B